MLDQVAGGALEALLDRLFGDQERAGDFGVAESAQGLQGQGDLVLARRRGWQQAKIIRSWLSSISVSRNSSSMSVVVRGARGGPLLA